MHLIMIEVLRSGYEKSSEGCVVIDKFSDARINKVLSAIHQEPENNWSLLELATISGMSRAGFSKIQGGNGTHASSVSDKLAYAACE